MIFIVTQNELGDVALYSAKNNTEIPIDRSFNQCGFNLEQLNVRPKDYNLWTHWDKYLSGYEQMFKDYYEIYLFDGSVLFKPKIAYCPFCNSYEEYTLEEVEDIADWEGKPTQYLKHETRCKKCGKEIYINDCVDLDTRQLKMKEK